MVPVSYTHLDLEMARTLDGFVDGETERREGVILYGASDTEFRYVEVTFGKDWIPGISWFYLPEPEIMLNHYDLTVYSKGCLLYTSRCV